MKALIPTALVLVTAACGAGAPPHQLASARSAYDQAANGAAGQIDPADLHTAKETLNAAEKAYADNGATTETTDIAYVAERRAQIATARADAMQAMQQRDAIVARMNANQSAQVQLTSAALGQANQQLAAQQQALAAEKARAADAEMRASQAAADLARIASVKQDARGLVITLSGSVLFASGKSEILPAARTKLDDVAKALTKQQDKSTIVVEGYTDSRGSDALNQELSERRAETVRAYLASKGVPSDRLTAKGMGPASPIADNASAEGRANNRRVEIVVQPPK